MIEKRSVPQPVFESAEARRVQKLGHQQACTELEAKFAAGGPFDEGDPNHPMHQRKLFGYGESELLAKQYPTCFWGSPCFPPSRREHLTGKCLLSRRTWHIWPATQREVFRVAILATR